MDCSACFQFLSTPQQINDSEKKALQDALATKQKELEDKRKQLGAEKEKSGDLHRKVSSTKQRTEELEQKVGSMKAVPAPPDACCAGIAAICQKDEAEMQAAQRLLEERQAELVKAKAALELLKAKREEEGEEDVAQSGAQAAQQEPEPEDNVPSGDNQPSGDLPFSSSRSFFRGKTPLEHRAIKDQIESLLEEMKTIDEQQDAEKQLQEELKQQQDQYESTAALLEGRLVARPHAGSNFESFIRKQVKKDETVTQLMFGSFTDKFRTETPANKQKMRGEVETFLAELEEVVKSIDEETQVQNKIQTTRTERKNSTMSERSPTAFAYKQDRLKELNTPGNQAP